MSTDVDEPTQEPEPHPYRPVPADAKADGLPPYQCPSCDSVLEGTKLDRSPDVSRLTRHSYLAGLAGTLTVLGAGYLASRRKVFEKGWFDGEADGFMGSVVRRLGWGEHDTHRSMAFVLLVCSVVMFAVELAIRFDVDRGRLIKLAPDVKQRQYGKFFRKCLLVYAVELGLLTLVLGVPASFLRRLGVAETSTWSVYRTVNEYGFRANQQGYYKPWFVIMDAIWYIYFVGGLPYVLLTRALQHAPRSDRKQAAFTVIKVARNVFARLRGQPAETSRDFGEAWGTLSLWRWLGVDRYDKSAFLGLGVKFFFVPLMTVFFADQFLHLVKNYDWMTGPNFRLANVNMRDVHNVSHSVIFSVDVGLAWCGYVVSSRWIKNTLFSTEPTMEGWMMALFCYPPINRIPGFFYSTPPEDAFFNIPNPSVVAFFAICSILSFSVYTSATVMFGLRFSNLTHRGIIDTGPYALIRHPAYASKNFSWWCVMLPYAIYEIYTTKSPEPLLQVAGMVIMSFLYYRRAITEEQHLSRDPEYRKYMKKVPYRFIPGLL
jgi:protein-S-isoprenylcysteine O-methyltransferase Ste14